MDRICRFQIDSAKTNKTNFHEFHSKWCGKMYQINCHEDLFQMILQDNNFSTKVHSNTRSHAKYQYVSVFYSCSISPVALMYVCLFMIICMADCKHLSCFSLDGYARECSFLSRAQISTSFKSLEMQEMTRTCLFGWFAMSRGEDGNQSRTE